ncbi:acetyltransferase [Planotetraspora silvatica]|uniref:Acetyltransferase n=1 Tax=Planotetraspora silvatica TaxID=234614 RepID=A0A8J3UN09_9ACTN|nr:GNAT family N-acetyltransferase [Planotetraspora silvatica]GII47380.1 acetyltransferase [Planotetraspora silvatica]
MGFRAGLVDDVRFVRDVLGGRVFVAERGGEVVGASAGLLFGRSGWLGGIAVSPSAQRQGLGGALTAETMEWLSASGAGTQLLHATAVGLPLYARLGFVTEVACVQYHSPDPLPPATPYGVRDGRMSDLPAVLRLDREATGEDRSALLTRWWPSDALVCLEGGEITGFRLAASGNHTAGAVIGSTPQSGRALLQSVYGDIAKGGVAIPVSNGDAAATLAAAGLRESVTTTRMYYGERPMWRPTWLYGLFNLFWG